MTMEDFQHQKRSRRRSAHIPLASEHPESGEGSTFLIGGLLLKQLSDEAERNISITARDPGSNQFRKCFMFRASMRSILYITSKRSFAISPDSAINNILPKKTFESCKILLVLFD
jgi:hypothetical protein